MLFNLPVLLSKAFIVAGFIFLITSCTDTPKLVVLEISNSDGLSLAERDEMDGVWDGYSVTGIQYNAKIDSGKNPWLADLANLNNGKSTEEIVILYEDISKFVINIQYKSTISGNLVLSNWTWTDFMNFRFNSNVADNPQNFDYTANHKYTIDVRGSSIEDLGTIDAEEYEYALQ